MANDKVFSVRADDETIAKLEQIAETSGMKKAELLPALMSAYEVQEAKGALPGRATQMRKSASSQSLSLASKTTRRRSHR